MKLQHGQEFGRWYIDLSTEPGFVVFRPNGYYIPFDKLGKSGAGQDSQHDWYDHVTAKKWCTDDDATFLATALGAAVEHINTKTVYAVSEEQWLYTVSGCGQRKYVSCKCGGNHAHISGFEQRQKCIIIEFDCEHCSSGYTIFIGEDKGLPYISREGVLP